ncbi:MAG: NUDIX hydrolase [Pseudanabaenaceae cyanobacterium]
MSLHRHIETRLYHRARKFNYSVEVLQLPNGAVGEYAYIQHPGAAIVVPVTDSGEFVLVKQYRFPIQEYVWEFPAGTLDGNEHHRDTIKRELAEETGYEANNWQYLGAFYICPGYSNEVIHAYLATELQKLAHPPAQDADEDIQVEIVSKAQLHDWIAQPKDLIKIDAKSVTCFYMALASL